MILELMIWMHFKNDAVLNSKNPAVALVEDNGREHNDASGCPSADLLL
jgi:hypothetical protein